MPRFITLIFILLSLQLCQQPVSAEGYPDNFYQSDRPPMLGINMGRAGDNGGVKVHNVYSGTAAENMGLQRGDVIKVLNGINTNSPRELWRAVRSHDPGDEVKVTVVRDGQEHEFHSQFKEWPKHIPGSESNWGNRSQRRNNGNGNKTIIKKTTKDGETIIIEKVVKKGDKRGFLNKLADALKKNGDDQSAQGSKNSKKPKSYDGSPIKTDLSNEALASPIMHVAAAMDALGKDGWQFDFKMDVNDKRLPKPESEVRAQINQDVEAPDCDVSCYWTPTAIEL